MAAAPTPATTGADELRELVNTTYPSYSWMLGIPEIADLLLEAVDPNRGFSAAEFTAKLQATEWWKSHADSFRQWEALKGTDPASAAAQTRSRAAEIENVTRQLGLDLSPAQVALLAEDSLRFGMPATSAVMQNAYANLFRPGAATGGDFGATLTEIKRLANQEYLVGISDRDAWEMARQVAAGDLTTDGIRQTLQQASAGRFAGLGIDVAGGVTPGQFFAPYRNMIAQEMETTAEGVNLMDQKWAPILQQHTQGGMRPMTMSEALSFVRSTGEWKNTSRAKQMGADFTLDLLKTFGAVQ